jgi:hypothetical protein
MAPREKMKTRQLAPLSPLWAGAVAAIASLYGLWPGMGLYRESGQSGEILVLLLFFGPISFLFVMIPAVLLLGAIFRRIEQRNRWIAALLLVALFLAVAGVPGLFGLLVLALGFYFAWSQARKEQVFTEEREQFDGTGDVRDVDVGAGFLARFADPLWNRMDLEECKPRWAIEGEQDSARYMVIEIEHRSYGLMADQNIRFTTTFILAAIPATTAGRQITWYPPGYHAWADRDYVYLAKPNQQARPSTWQGLIAGAIRAMGSLEQRSAKAGRKGAVARPYSAVGGGVMSHALSGVVMLGFALLMLWGSLAPLFGWVDPSAIEVEMVPKFLLASLVCFGGVWYFAERARVCWRRQFD